MLEVQSGPSHTTWGPGMAQNWPSGPSLVSDIDSSTNFVQMAKLGPFPPPSGPRWSRLNSKHPFFIRYQCCCSEICPKIDIWGWGWSRWPSFGHFRPPHGPRRNDKKDKMIKIKFRYHLKKQKFALKCLPEAVLEVLLLLGVALKANLGIHPNHVFWHLLTTPNT